MRLPSPYFRLLLGIETWLFVSTSLVAQQASPTAETVTVTARPQALIFLRQTEDLIVVGDDSVQFFERRDGHPVSHAVWQGQGKPLLVAASQFASEIAIYSREHGIVMVTPTGDAVPRPLETGELPELTSLRYSNDGSSLVGRTASNRIIYWSAEDGSTITDQQLTDFVGPVAIASDADFAVGEHGPDGLVIWDIATNSLRHHIEAGDGSVSAIAISPSGRLIAGAPTRNPELVNIWDAASGQLLLALDVPGDAKSALLLADDDHSLTVVDASGLVSVWEVPFKLPLGTFQLPGGLREPYAVTSDGSWVATSADTSITISPIQSEYARPEPSESSLPTYTVSAPMEYSMEYYSDETGSAVDEPAMPADERAEEPTAEAPSGDETAAPDRDPAATEQPETTTSDDSRDEITGIPVLFGTNRASERGATWREYFAGFFFTWLSCLIYLLFAVAVIFAGLAIGRRAARRTAALFLGLLLVLGAIYAQFKTSERFQMLGDEFGGQLDKSGTHYGRCVVTIPPDHISGALESPFNVWVVRGSENPQEHVTIRELVALDADSFSEQLRMEMSSTNSRDVLVFVHGYNVSFRDAIRRTAQLKHDLKFPGPGICFSWPSHADPVRYPFDASNAESSVGALRDFLNHVAQTNATGRVHLIAHSMGNRVLAGALPLIDAAARERIGYVVLAAPDVHRPQFLDPIARMIAAANHRATLYVSSRDRALQISKYFNNVQRAGERDPELTLCDGFETIDASAVDTSLLGHSYYGDIPTVIDDLASLITENKMAAERLSGSATQVGGRTYWRLEP